MQVVIDQKVNYSPSQQHGTVHAVACFINLVLKMSVVYAVNKSRFDKHHSLQDLRYSGKNLLELLDP
jgi:hypothetical protein